jgi:hypothetical protein
MGFMPVGHLSGGEVRPRPYKLTAGVTVYKGDVVELDAAGTVGIAEAADATAAIGIAAHYVDDSASAGGLEILVYDDPGIIYKVQEQSGGTGPEADVGLCADAVMGAASTTTLNSGHELSSTHSTGTAMFKILGKYEIAGNDWGENVEFLVIFNEHRYDHAGSAGV